MFKLVYDLSEDYETYNFHFIQFKPSCDNDYENAIKSYKYLYKDLRKKCFIEKTNYHEEYYKAFNNYFTGDKHAQISLWSCQLREPEEQVQKFEEEHSEVTAKEPMPEKLAVGRQQIQGDSVKTAQHSRSIVSYLNKDVFDEFTPAKSWINKLLGRKQMYRNPYANQELMANFSMPEDFYLERNRYNIMYNPE
ncbi:hypothetical protein PVC01_000124900 [Plasmodium vivax]|uniref:VIR protein n=1 Tax=Plasmodium vivax TaxID=5855 RepID=A0A1G4EDV9_PLAVI|nr:hypothetical protein PVC01_000124900 [Plasmodium vivax]